MNLKNKAKKYFYLFSSKNLDGLKNILGQKVLLVDWTIKLSGINNVIYFYYKTFKKFKKINVIIKEIFSDPKKRSIACKLIIKLDKCKIKVMDIIYFNKKKKIIRIEAYKL